MKILFTGGGTMGSVIPLLAVVEVLKAKDPSNDFYWIGTNHGPEKKIIKDYNIEFKSIYAGKFRRYFSWLNFLDILKVLIGLMQSIYLLLKWRPQIIVSAGGFTAVPVVWAGWLLGIPSLIHQQDVRVGLANKLCVWCAKQVTVCFRISAKYFTVAKTKVTGNPVREIFKYLNLQHTTTPVSSVTSGVIKQDLYHKLGLKKNMPIVLFMGGGTGSMAINDLVYNAIKKITQFCQVIHLTGRAKIKEFAIKDLDNYYQFDFLVNSAEVLVVADLVVSRAGMASLTEIAYLKKPAIIIPLPMSHQEDNAIYFAKCEAIIMLNQQKLTVEDFVQAIKNIVTNKKKMSQLSNKIYQVIEWKAEEKIANLILNIINSK